MVIINSMALKILIASHCLVMWVLCRQNLVYDGDFEMQGQNLPSTFNSSYEQYSYNMVNSAQPPSTIVRASANGSSYVVSTWYSQVSGVVKYRQLASRNTTVMDTLSNNYGQRICSDYHMASDVPYELAFDYTIDNNINFAQLKLTLNGQQLMDTVCYSHQIRSAMFTVYLRQSVNTLCFEGSSYENLPIGVLVDNVVLAKQEVRYIVFTPVISFQRLNYIELVSNQTVNDQSCADMSYAQLLQFYKSQSTLAIDSVMYRLDAITVNAGGYLTFRIQIEEQYASSTVPVVGLPQHRNNQSQLIVFVVSCTHLPMYIYSSEQDALLVEQSGFYVRILTTIYNICFRVIKIVAFCFVGMRLLQFFYLYLFLMFLNVQLILPAARNIINQIAINTINSKTINYFLTTAAYKPYTFGSQYLPLNQTFTNTNTPGLQYSAAGITLHVYDLIIDDLIIALFNTAKVLLICYVLFKSNHVFLRVMKQIKNSWILMEYVPILSVIVLAASLSCRQGVPMSTSLSNINRAICLILPIVSLFLCSAVFLRQDGELKRKYYQHLKKSNNIVSQNTQNRNSFYISLNYLNLIQGLMFVIIPALVGFQLVYVALATILTLTVMKLIFVTRCLKRNPNFIYFLWAISIFISICLVCSFIIPHLVMSFSNLQPKTEIAWISILRYNSIAILFMFIVGGFIQIGCSIHNFIHGFQVASLLCHQKHENEVQNSYEIEQILGEEAQKNLKNSQASKDIKTVNSIKDKIQKLSKKSESIKFSKQQISNPFINSQKNIQKKQVNTPKRQQKIQEKFQTIDANNKISKQNGNNKSEKKTKMTKVITLKHIEPAQQQITVQDTAKMKTKSFYHIPDQSEEKQIIVKKSKESKQKSLKLIKKLDISRHVDTQMSQEADTKKNIVVSNFQKLQNFS